MTSKHILPYIAKSINATQNSIHMNNTVTKLLIWELKLSTMALGEMCRNLKLVET
jgi:hypothetical protein